MDKIWDKTPSKSEGHWQMSKAKKKNYLDSSTLINVYKFIIEYYNTV